MGLDDELDKLFGDTPVGKPSRPEKTNEPRELKDPNPPKNDSSFPTEPKRSPNEAANHRTATVAPTNENTHTQLEDKVTGKKEGLTEEELDFVNLVDQYFATKGKLLDRATAVQDLFFKGDEFDELLGAENIQAALVERGVLTRGKRLLRGGKVTDGVTETKLQPDLTWQQGVLSPLQLLAANSMLDLIDTRSQKKKLQDLGIPTGTYNKWLADPVFSQYLQDVAERMLGNHQHEAHLALLDKVGMGDVSAIKYYNELQGRFTEAKAGPGGSGSNIGDVKSLLIKIFEVLQEEITDPELLVRIGERFNSMQQHQQAANNMVNAMTDDIVMPEIAKRRELSPKLAQMLERNGDDAEAS